jgi:hypothetical protein
MQINRWKRHSLINISGQIICDICYILKLLVIHYEICHDSITKTRKLSSQLLKLDLWHRIFQALAAVGDQFLKIRS